MKVSTRFDMFQIVYLKTDPDQLGRMVTYIKLLPGSVVYALSYGTSSSEHFEQEITTTANVVKKLTE